MEIEFYLNQMLDEKNAEGEVQTWHIPFTNWRLRKHGHQWLAFQLRIFDELLQLSSSLKFAKAELYLIGGCQDEWFELTYYIETLAIAFKAHYFFCFFNQRGAKWCDFS